MRVRSRENAGLYSKNRASLFDSSALSIPHEILDNPLLKKKKKNEKINKKEPIARTTSTTLQPGRKHARTTRIPLQTTIRGKELALRESTFPTMETSYTMFYSTVSIYFPPFFFTPTDSPRVLYHVFRSTLY